jgi:Right handed beta helix region
MALPATLVWEVRSGGNDANGGSFDPSVASPGTDFSVQDSPQVVHTDLVIGATTTQLTSALNPYTSAHVGNTENITGGTGFTTGVYSIRSVSGGVATMDRSVGTAASTGGTGNLGGGLATPGKAAGLMTAGNDKYIKKAAGAYTLSSTANVAGGRINDTVGGVSASSPGRWIGYSTNRTPTNTDAKPVLDVGANSMTAITLGATYARVWNIEITNSGAHTGVTGISASGGTNWVHRCKVSSANNGIDSSGSQNRIVDNLVSACGSGGGFTYSSNNGYFRGCVALNGTGQGFNISATFMPVLVKCLAINNATGGFITAASTPASFQECEAYGSTGTNADGFQFTQQCDFYNCISYGHNRYGFNLVTSANAPSCRLVNCAGGGNGTANLNSLSSVAEGFITLTGDPSNNAGSLDFSTNTTAGAGAALRGAGSPSSYPGLAGTSSPDVGAYQHADPVASGGSPSPVQSSTWSYFG